MFVLLSCQRVLDEIILNDQDAKKSPGMIRGLNAHRLGIEVWGLPV